MRIIAADPGLGLTPSRTSLKMSMHNLHLPWCDAALDALNFVKLARSEQKITEAGDASFTFAHRRFQEYFATCVVLRDPDRISPLQILTDGRWRETAVVLLQTQNVQKISAMLSLAEELVTAMNNKAANDRNSTAKGFSWPTTSLHLIGLLQDADNRKRIAPEALRRVAGELLAIGTKSGSLLDKVWALDVAGVAQEDVLVELLRNGFADRSRWLRSVAFRQAARLTTMPADIAEAIRVALIRYARDGTLLKETITMDALLSRLAGAKELTAVARLLRSTYRLDFCFFIIYGVLLLRARSFYAPIYAISFLPILTLLAVIAHAITLGFFVQSQDLRTNIDIGLRYQQRPKWQQRLFTFKTLGGLWLPSTVYVRFGLTFALVILVAGMLGHPNWYRDVDFLTSLVHLPRWLFVGGVYLALWTPAAVFYSKEGRFVNVGFWPFFPFLIFTELAKPLQYRRLWSFLRTAWRELLIAVAGYGLLIGLVVASTPLLDANIGYLSAHFVVLMTGPIFCTKWSVSVTPRWTIVRSRRRGCGDVGNAERFPYLHAPVALAR